MAFAPELIFQQLSTVQGANDPKPVTITAAATIAPTGFLTRISGSTAITTISPPITGAHLLAFEVSSTQFAGFGTSGNIAFASITNSTVWAGRLVLMIYNPLATKYYPIYGVVTTN